jgi:hypothetical protein
MKPKTTSGILALLAGELHGVPHAEWSGSNRVGLSAVADRHPFAG